MAARRARAEDAHHRHPDERRCRRDHAPVERERVRRGNARARLGGRQKPAHRVSLERRQAPNAPRRHAQDWSSSSPRSSLSASTTNLAALQPRHLSRYPMVFLQVSDPMAQGFVTSVTRPGRQHHRIFGVRIFDRRQVARTAEGGRAETEPRGGDVESRHIAADQVLPARHRVGGPHVRYRGHRGAGAQRRRYR